ncbi:MAG: acyl-CoA thioesterase [Opitutales bacterium]
MKFAHTVRRRVEFAETDMAGLVHFTNFFRYVELAEAEFFEDLGLPLIDANREQSVGWPRVRVNCSYAEPLYFRDQVEITIFVKTIKIRAIEWGFRIFRIESDETRVRAAKGSFTTVRVKKDNIDRGMTSLELPEELLSKIQEAPEGY